MRRPRGLPLLTLALAACGRGERGDAWFPLDPGHRWTYRVATSEDSAPAVAREVLTIETLPPDAMPDKGGRGDPGHRRSADGVDYWLRADASGIYRVARQAMFEEAPRLDTPPRYVLKAPYAVGTEWQAPTVAYLLARRFDRPREVRHAYKPVPMTYRIEATDEAVETPAGHWTGCLRVRGAASIRVYTDPVAGWREMPLTTNEWYCKGPGLVKLERTEPVTSPFMSGGTRVMELEAFR